MQIDCTGLAFKELNRKVRAVKGPAVLNNCCGQRYLASGMANADLTVTGTPGNALGAYLAGGRITVYGNAQDVVGDTMGGGTIAIHGMAGDAAGYAMRGGKILIHGNTGYRAGIHMKAYEDKKPLLLIGGSAGSFLGEYQAGGTIIVLGLSSHGAPPVGYFCGTGMHGGKIYLRCKTPPADLPAQITATKATEKDKEEIRPYLEEFCEEFQEDLEKILAGDFLVLTPDTENPYKQLYTPN